MNFVLHKTKIRVTKDHIGLGVAHNCHACPIALAIMCVVKHDIGVSVHVSHPAHVVLGLRFGLETCVLFLPDKVGKWARSFDCGLPVKPTRFKLDIPTEFLGANNE